ncbi:MAG: PAS domain S-box protein, partial [Gammaproteobacteria bacterium]|nr:PAS domain S-box protein [Gammaproteobacteria bacterium]
DVFDFTVPYLSLFGGIVVRTRDEAIHTADDLRDRKVGVMAGDNAEEYMRREGFTQSLVSTESFSDALRLLSQGQLDAVVVQELVALQLIDELGLDGLEIRARLTGFRQDFCFAVTDGDKELLAILNEGLSRIVANGAYTQLREKWLGSHDPDKIIETDYRLFRQVAIPLLLVLIVILFWNRRLHREIVARRKMERALRESEQQVKDLLDSTAEAIYGLDMHGECIFANPACVRVLGYRNAGELIGRNMHDLIHHKHPDDTPYPTDECPIFRAFLSGNGTHVDTEVLWRADGSSFSAEYWAYPLRRDGEVIGAVVTFLDITERKQAENALLSEKQLSEEYINSLPGLFYVFDEERFVRWNREWSRVTGYSDGELASRYGTDFFEGEDRHLIEVRMLKVFRKGLADAEAELVTKDGRKIPYYFTGLRKKIDGKEHLVGLGLDITRRKQSEAEQERLQRELQQAQKMEALGQLTGGIAHDFNNILGIILGNNELALNYCAPDGQTKLARHLNNIHKAGTRAATLVAKMLAYSRSEASDDKPLQLQALVKEDLKMLSSTLPSSIEITAKIEENLPPVLMDQTQLSQLLMNLCVNAQDAMEGKGGLTIRL